MATLHVKDVPSDLFERLQAAAGRARRSLRDEAIAVLERGLPKEETRVSFEEFISRADSIRADHRLTEGAPTAAELIREGRDR